MPRRLLTGERYVLIYLDEPSYPFTPMLATFLSADDDYDYWTNYITGDIRTRRTEWLAVPLKEMWRTFQSIMNRAVDNA